MKPNEKKLPVIALRGFVVFPYMVMHFDIAREISLAALDEAAKTNNIIFLLSQKDENLEEVNENDLYRVGTIAKIKQSMKLKDGNVRILIEGISRAEVLDIEQMSPYISATIREYEEIPFADSNAEMLLKKAKEIFGTYIEHSGKVAPEIIFGINGVNKPGQFADLIAANIEAETKDKQEILEAFDPTERLTRLLRTLNNEISMLQFETQINDIIKSKIDEKQHEYYLREQLEVIQDELSKLDPSATEITELVDNIKKAGLPAFVQEKLDKEISRLKKTAPSSPEAGLIKTYIDYVLELPWNTFTEDNIDVKKAETILNEDHYGLEKVKERILEFLAVKALTNKTNGTILCLVGPPGVGKTSVAKSVARSLDRKYVRVSLGGVRDEADIRGHRKTYIGAMPGRIMSAIKEAGTSNPLILLDEVDKMSMDLKGDPSAALLEVLDSEQNYAFRDHFIEVPYDLSNVMFVCTANSLSNVQRPLLDRMEIIEISGYTDDEKMCIAKQYLVPKQLEKHGLKKSSLRISDDVISDITDFYTRESGVRGLERKIGAICRKSAKLIISKDKKRVDVTSKNIEDFLGVKIYTKDRILSEDTIGVATGLAWTAVGGDILFIEVNIMDGTGKIQLTGQLGDVMKESANAAISYIRSKSEELGIDKEFYSKKDIHVHVPEGATPKDGPSAGITIATAIISALTGNPVRRDVAMTGEITLRGRVLPIGGLKEKTLAAYKSGIKTIIIPAENKKDLDEIPNVVKQNVSIVFASNIDTVINTAIFYNHKESHKQKNAAEIPFIKPGANAAKYSFTE